MSDLKLVNVATTERLSTGTVLRVTVGKAYGALNDSYYAAQLGVLYGAIPAQKHGFPISPNPSGVRDGKPAVIDVRLTSPIVLADFAAIISSLGAFYIHLQQIERLTDAKARTAGGRDGAIEREVTKEKQAVENADHSISGQISKALGVAKHIVIGAAVVAAVVALLVYGPQLSANFRKR